MPSESKANETMTGCLVLILCRYNNMIDNLLWLSGYSNFCKNICWNV